MDEDGHVVHGGSSDSPGREEMAHDNDDGAPREFAEEKYAKHPNLSVEGLDKMMAKEFVDWFKTACKKDPTSDEDLWNLANGCSSKVLSYNSYDVNGFRFRSELYEKNKTRLRTVNTGFSCLPSHQTTNN
ncbi:hypothetical protein ACQ4PT_045974 [Festuca glaucescens]